MVTITRNAQSVDCYGEWKPDSNCHCVFDDENLGGIYADGAESWTQAVEILTAHAARKHTVLIELSAC